jgi:hypothetical protein
MLTEVLALLLRPAVEQIAADLGLATRDELAQAVRQLEDRMTTAEQAEAQSNERFAALLGTVIAEIKSLRANVEAFPAQLAQAVADGDQERANALASDALADAARVDAYTDMLSELYPAEVPTVPVPEPGQPADPPIVEGGDPIEVPPVDSPVVDVPVVEGPVDGGEDVGTTEGTGGTA